MGLLDALFGGGTSADDVNSILASTAANASALSNVAAANANTLVGSVITGMTNMVNTTLQTTLEGVTALEESAMAGSAEAMNSVATSAIAFTEASSVKTYDSAGNLLSENQSVSHDGGATIMSAYAAHTLGPLMEGIGNGIAGMMTGVGNGSGQAMANLGTHVPGMLPGLSTALGAQISGSLGASGLLANSSL